MASDGVIFKFFSKSLPKARTPYIACIVSGFAAGTKKRIYFYSN